MKKQEKERERFMSSVIVGPKGQIVIPKTARDMFGIKSGDKLLLLADSERGIAIQRQDFMNQIADAVFDGRAAEVAPEESEENMKTFAEAIRKNCEET